MGNTLDRQVTGALDQVVLESVQLGRLEGDLGIPFRVEEVRRLEMAVEVLFCHVDACDLGRAFQRSVLATSEGRGEFLEGAAERADARVDDLEEDCRVDGVCSPGSCRGELFFTPAV